MPLGELLDMPKDPRVLIWPIATTVLLLLLMAWLVWKLRSWWREDANDAETDHQILARYREMNLRGELSDEEYRSIKSQMAMRLGIVPAAPRPAPGRQPKSAETALAAAANENTEPPPPTEA
jgi:hypothetical protein